MIINKQGEIYEPQKSTVCIEEVVSQEFEVLHSEDEDPIETAKEKYWSGDFVLSPGEVQCRKIAVVAPSGHESEWQEF